MGLERSGRVTYRIACIGALAIVSARASNRDSARALTGGDPERGRIVAEAYACGTCHTIPGIGTATSKIGPMLGGFARRSYIAGQLANSPENLMLWLEEPQTIEPHTAMPSM